MDSKADISASEMSVWPSASDGPKSLSICRAASAPVSTRQSSVGESLKKEKYNGSNGSPTLAFTRMALSSAMRMASRNRALAPCIEPEASSTYTRTAVFLMWRGRGGGSSSR